MLGDKVYRINEGLTKISEINWRYVIYTGEGWKVQIKKKGLFMSWSRCSQKMECDTLTLS